MISTFLLLRALTTQPSELSEKLVYSETDTLKKKEISKLTVKIRWKAPSEVAFLSVFMALILGLSMVMPTLGAVQYTQKSETLVQVEINGETQDFLIRILDSGNKIEIKSVSARSSDYVELVTISRPPPYPCWVMRDWMDFPAFHIYLCPTTAFNMDTALAVIAILLDVIAGVTGGLAIVPAVLASVIALDYHLLYSDKNGDDSFDIWVPYDPYNTVCSMCIHICAKTPHWWWIVSFGAWRVARVGGAVQSLVTTLGGGGYVRHR